MSSSPSPDPINVLNTLPPSVVRELVGAPEPDGSHFEVSCTVDDRGEEAEHFAERGCSCGIAFSAYGARCKQAVRALFDAHVADPTGLVQWPREPLRTADLPHFAEFLAREFEHNPLRAARRGAGWYREQVGPDVCTATMAIALRSATIERCRAKAAENKFTLRDFLRRSPDGDVADAPANRARRAGLMASLPGRVDAGIAEADAGGGKVLSLGALVLCFAAGTLLALAAIALAVWPAW